jgi:hypothetical protein
VKINSARQQHKFLILVLFSVSLLLLQGCGGVRKGITIDSRPQGADILADGKNIGKTPLLIKQDDVFPPHWYGRTYMVKGNLEIQKEGCEGFNMEVNDFVLSKDINANLKCNPGMMQSNAPAAVPAAGKPEVEQAVPASSKAEPGAVKKSTSASNEIEQRLSRLKDLRDRGVITAEEYAEQRKRILESI